LLEETGEVAAARVAWEEARGLYAELEVRDGVAEAEARLAGLATA
jgi:hypothetical protein